MEVVCEYKRNNKPGVIVLIDLEKFFDRVEYNSIKGAFKYFGFGDKFIKLMFLLFTQLEICTSNSGYCSQKEEVWTRGALPRHRFCYCSEIMSHLIYQNANIKGLTINGIEQILSQFADDTSAFLECTELWKPLPKH